MYTRQNYLNHECTHDEYYGQFVSDRVREIVTQAIGMEQLKASDDIHFNDISLARWDSLTSWLPANIKEQLRACGDFLTQAGAVCILKEAARQLLLNNRK